MQRYNFVCRYNSAMDDYCSNIDQQLLDAYQNTIYQIRSLCLQIRIGERNETLEKILKRHSVDSWAFISAWNPGSKQLPEQENAARHRQLVKVVTTKQWKYWEGSGIGADTSWQPELSLLILGVSKVVALEIGRQFEQNAIVFGESQQVPELLLLR